MPKRKARVTQNVSDASEWIWHQTILNEIEFCSIRNLWEHQGTEPEDVMEFAPDSMVQLNV
jgi:hypothetical protein